MTAPILQTAGFAAAVIDALASHIYVIDRHGEIVAVNRAWRTFGQANSASAYRSDVGTHYLRICRAAAGPGSEEAEGFALGVQSVLSGATNLFTMEYPCHSPTESRWFLGRVTPLEIGEGGAVISHLNITDRKMLELDLARLASTDSLTDLPNRRYFHQIGNMEVERIQQFGGLAAVLMIDLDHFKAVNDTHGHAMGDEVLRHFAQVCANVIRKVDILARIGGEEFAALLPATSVDGAQAIAERLRRMVEDTPLSHLSGTVRLTASFGLTAITPLDKSIKEPLKRADGALYEAKRSGRNRVRTDFPTTNLT